MAEAEAKTPKTLAEKVEWLFQNVRDPDTDQHYSHARVAARIERLCPGFNVAPATIWNLRTGKSDNPSWRLIEGLAKAFGVSPLYFSEDSEVVEQIEQEVALLAALKRADVREVALRAQGLTPENLAPVLDILERVRELQRRNSSHQGTPESERSQRS